MTTRDLLSALRSQDYRGANKAFAMVMQAKLADRLAEEKQDILNEGRALSADEERGRNFANRLIEKLPYDSAVNVDARAGASFDPCVECKSCEESVNLSASDKDIESFVKEHSKHVGRHDDINESTMPSAEVQRVYDETRDPFETEILCGVKHVKVNSRGEVVSFVAEGITDANSSGQGRDDDYVNNPYHGVIRKYGYQYSHSTPVTHGSEKIVHHTYKHGEHNVSVWGNNWNTSTSTASGRQVSGGHPNTARAAADLERHLVNKAQRYKLEY